jgi:hypothetical protein
MIGVFAFGFHYVNIVYGIEAEQHMTNQLEELMLSFGALYWIVFLAPPALFLGMMASVPVLAKKLLIRECHIDRKSVIHSYVVKVFAFSLVINLVLASLAWTIIVYNASVDSVSKTSENEKLRMWTDLSGTFHICVIFVEAFVFMPIRLYRGWNLVNGRPVIELPLFSLPCPALPFNPAMKYSEVESKETLQFDFGKQYAEMFSILAMLLAYAPIIPVLYPVGWLFFETLARWDAQILRSQFKPQRTAEQPMRTVARYLQLTVIVGQGVPLVFIALQGTALMICSVALFALVTTIGYIVYLDRADNGGKLVYKRLEKIFPFLTLQKHSAGALVENVQSVQATAATAKSNSLDSATKDQETMGTSATMKPFPAISTLDFPVHDESNDGGQFGNDGEFVHPLKYLLGDDTSPLAVPDTAPSASVPLEVTRSFYSDDSNDASLDFDYPQLFPTVSTE